VFVQAVVIANLAGERDDSTEMRAVRPTVVDKGPWVKVNFKADARETDIRLALVQVGGSLTAGPSQLGDWYVRVPEGRFAAALESLKASPVIESAVQVDALPERR
jgi:hypothetical protein